MKKKGDKSQSNIIHNKLIKAIIVVGVNRYNSKSYMKYGTLIDLSLLFFRDRKKGWKIKNIKDKRTRKWVYRLLRWK